MKLPVSFYQDNDVVLLARELLGKVLFTNLDRGITGGIITETEAYAGAGDRASHAYGGRRTIRTEPMYMDGGIAYVYLIYGIHSLFNVVTAPSGTPHAILIRAIKPIEGIPLMLSRRKTLSLNRLCDGPGKLTRALGIHYSHTGLSLAGNKIWIEDRGVMAEENIIIAGPRVGIDYAGEDAKLPYRFCIHTPD